jgi:hypothetical protein
MTGVPPLRAASIAIGLAALAGVGLTVPMPDGTTPVALQTAEEPACTNCDAHHARLTKLRATVAEETE